MNLTTANEKLLEVYKQYETAQKELQVVEYAYQVKKARMYLDSGMGTNPLKEAEVTLLLDTDGIGKEYSEKSMKAKTAYFKLIAIQEYCKNLRQIHFTNSVSGGE